MINRKQRDLWDYHYIFGEGIQPSLHSYKGRREFSPPPAFVQGKLLSTVIYDRKNLPAEVMSKIPQ